MPAAATAGPKTLAEAIVAFQADAPKIGLDGTNPHFNSKFATLAKIMEAVRPALAKQGLAISQHPTACGEPPNHYPALKTILIHSGGEQIESVMPLAVDRGGPQAQGSALTYARRYAVLAVLGLVGDEDDDANSAEAAKKEPADAEVVKFPTPSARKKLDAVIARLVEKEWITPHQVASACEATLDEAATLDDLKPVLDGLSATATDELIQRLVTYGENKKAEEAAA